MKKLFAYVALCALLLSFVAVTAAAYVPNVAFTPGTFAGVSGEDFTPVGDVEIEWCPDFGQNMDLSDGDLTDWKSSSLTPHTITPNNMISWQGGQAGVLDPAMPANWQITAYYAADDTYLYMAYDIVDDTFVYGTEGSHYNGDAIQLCMDFGNKISDHAEKNPDMFCCVKNIFYSFTCTEDGAPIQIMCQESDQDGPLTEAGGHGVKGAARKTDTGWSVEFAMSWQLLYDDYVWKAWQEDPRISVGTDEILPFKMGCCLYYLNRTETNGAITWAAGTLQGVLMDDGIPGVSWTHHDNGIKLILPYTEELSFDCTGIVCVKPTETTAAPEVPTEPAEEVTAAPTPNTDAETTAPETPSTPDTEGEYHTLPVQNGCYGTVSMSMLLFLSAAAAYALRQKE
ncbi:MAG: hypothetical protein IJX72_02035 [Clostridia bacterium]|nr:hypothetical protein [Clostridia bacterium]